MILFPPDVQLRLPAAPTAIVRIVDAATGSEVDSIDPGHPVREKTLGGFEGYHYYSLIVRGQEVTVVPRPGALTYGQTYRVEIGHGMSWTFSTRAAPPAPGARRLTVAADGTGDFCTVQGALDFIPTGNVAPVTVWVRRGTYREMVAFAHKDHVSIVGEDRSGTVIEYANNERFNFAGNPYGQGGSPDREGEPVYHRAVLLAHRDRDFTLRNLTLRNLTPHGGSQAECLIVNGTDRAGTRIEDVDFHSFQDTVQINGQAYVRNCRIEGDVDFMWGTGPCYLERCTAVALTRGAFFTQIRNPGSRHGFVFVDCALETAPGVTGASLTRIEPKRFPSSEVVFVGCAISPNVKPPVWPARVLHAPEDAAAIRDFSDPAYVLGGEWGRWFLADRATRPIAPGFSADAGQIP